MSDSSASLLACGNDAQGPPRPMNPIFCPSTPLPDMQMTRMESTRPTPSQWAPAYLPQPAQLVYVGDGLFALLGRGLEVGGELEQHWAEVGPQPLAPLLQG